jgi:hypothetical protein
MIWRLSESLAVFFFKQAEDTSLEDLPIIVGTDNIIQKAFEELNRYSWTAEELDLITLKFILIPN